MPQIRPEQPADYDSVRTLLLTAFRRETQPLLADRLRAAGELVVALVAEDKQRMLGHLMISRVAIVTQEGEAGAAALALLAVLPAFQRLGVGSALVSAGLDHCRQAGHPRVLVMGDAGYFARFGFVPAARYGLQAPGGWPDTSMLALELETRAFERASGSIVYGHAFEDLG